MDDHELLQNFVADRSQDAFRQLVDRHLPMVYLAACRLVSDSNLAQDVAQNVFSTLAQKAASIKPPQVVGGWLYNTTRHVAMHTIRGEQRRREREQTAAAMQMLHADSDSDRISRLLEPAMAELDAADCDALVLRYFENLSLRQVGSEFGITEDAARMRVNRAVERLREVFDRQGVNVSSVVLGSILTVSTTAAIPAGLGAAITTAALGTTMTTALTIATMNWINAKSITAIVTATVLTGTGTYFVQQRQIDQLRTAQQELYAHNAKLAEDNEEARAAAEAAGDQVQSMRQNTSDLLRLRNENGQLRQQLAAAKEAESRAQVQRTPAPALPPAGRYLSREQLANHGYATPEAALQTLAWATTGGDEEQITEALSPELLTNSVALGIFQRNQQTMAPMLKGAQLLAKKALTQSEVEIKVQYDLDPGNGAVQSMIAITPMLRGPDGWKLGVTRDYDARWEQSGQIEEFIR